MTAPVRLVVVEDSPVQRAHLREVLEADRDIAVVGQAGDPVEAVAMVRRLRPDVVTMDLGLPGEGGLGAIEWIMAEVPTPILVLSARATCAASAAAVESLLAGAVEALPRPEPWDLEAERQVRLLAKGAVAIVQDEPTSVVYGMPGAARRLGAAGEVVGLGQVPAAIRDAVARLVRP